MKIVLSNNQDIFGLDQIRRDKLKEALTFDNPAYNNAKRYGRSRYISIPPYLTYYGEHSVKSEDGERKKILTAPIGVNLIDLLKLPKDIQIDDWRMSVPVKYPPFRLKLRESQQKAEEAYLKDIDSVYHKNIIQMPTGKGKSILALHNAMTLGQKMLVLVHKDDLVVGWKKDIELCFGDIDVGLIKAKSRKVGEQITIATVQTLNRMSQEELDTYLDEFGIVVQDEVHHIGLNIFNVIDKFNSRYKLGLSATPKRTDGLNFVLDIFLGGLCYQHEVVENDKDITNVEVRLIDSPFKYRPFSVDGQPFNYYDFKKKDLPDHLVFVDEMPYDERPRIPYLVIDNEAVLSELTGVTVCEKIIEEYEKGHSILALFTQKEHINAYYAYLCENGVPENKIMLYYGDSKESSAVMMKKAESKEVLITLATYAKATEGTNVKSWEVLFLVSSLNNGKNVEQATGRIRRKKTGKLDPVIVYDVRYEGCYSLRSHYATRLSTYKKLKYKVVDPKAGAIKKRSLFTRGYV